MLIDQSAPQADLHWTQTNEVVKDIILNGASLMCQFATALRSQTKRSIEFL